MAKTEPARKQRADKKRESLPILQRTEMLMHCFFFIRDACNDANPGPEWWELSALGKGAMVRRNAGVPIDKRGGADVVQMIYYKAFPCDSSSTSDQTEQSSTCECIRQESQNYGYRFPDQYRHPTGPNSNTFVAAISELCEIGPVAFPKGAIGSDFRPCERDGEEWYPRDNVPKWRGGRIPPSWTEGGKCNVPRG